MTVPTAMDGVSRGLNIDAAFSALADAAQDWRPVSGWTHNFYRYPARFSPRFAAVAIEQFTSPGDLVLDPYMGGGTSVVEAMAAGRHAIGNDLNSLAVFVAAAKTTALTPEELHAVHGWASMTVPVLSYRVPQTEEQDLSLSHHEKTRNLSQPRARFIKKGLSIAMESVRYLPTANSQAFARCVLLRAGQWALDGRICHTPLKLFRRKVEEFAEDMLGDITALALHASSTGGSATLLNVDAAQLHEVPSLRRTVGQPQLVVTSPPYPGVHVLYHRWQVGGRRETPAPYWITGCNDGQGASYYNFGDRRSAAADRYFQNSLRTLRSIRQVIHPNGHVVQLVAFNRPEEQLPRYLDNMKTAGFSEVIPAGATRIWRRVPNRKWHASLRGDTHSANEVVLVHRPA